MLRQAVILAGGRGTRLGETTIETPKPLLEVGGRPFLEYLIWNLKRYGITRILLSVGYLASRIIDHFGDGSGFGVSIEYIIEPEPAGTGGALFYGIGRLEEMFLVLNGDTIFDINYLDLVLEAEESDKLVTLALRRVPDTKRYGRVVLQDGTITGFNEKNTSGSGLINAGIYLVKREALKRMSGIPCSLENDLFPKLADENKLGGKAYEGFFIDIGIPETLQEAEYILPAWQRKPAVFLDRDGVLNIDKGYVHKPEDFAWIKGAPQAIKWLNDHGFFVIVISNQAGIARGYYSEEEFKSFSDWINHELWKIGAHIDATYYCPHHPVEGRGVYLKKCDCRKPEFGLLLKAVKEWPIDIQISLMIGDKESDIKAAKAVGVRGFLFEGGDLLKFTREIMRDGLFHVGTRIC